MDLKRDIQHWNSLLLNTPLWLRFKTCFACQSTWSNNKSAEASNNDYSLTKASSQLSKSIWSSWQTLIDVILLLLLCNVYFMDVIRGKIMILHGQKMYMLRVLWPNSVLTKRDGLTLHWNSFQILMLVQQVSYSRPVPISNNLWVLGQFMRL